MTRIIHVLVIFHFQAHVFSSKNGACAAFLANYHSNSAARVKFNNRNYDLPPWSISILPDCRTDVFNTARVRIFEEAFCSILIKYDGSYCCSIKCFLSSLPFATSLLIGLLCLHACRWGFKLHRYKCYLAILGCYHGRPMMKMYLR